MNKNISNSLKYFMLLLLALLVTGCAGSIKNMQVVSPDKIVTAPERGKSMVVFMRPSGMAFGIQSSVFDVTNKKPELVGIIAAKKKVSYQVDPGERLFMVVGESADFMSAKLDPNKIYYASVAPRMGLWKARFSLIPIHADELNSSQFLKNLEGCEWVEKTEESDNWANGNMPDIVNKKLKYYRKWMSKDISQRPRLLPQDGR